MGKRKRTTIHDVARRAGVSTATVSYALNGKGRVERATRERIIEIARDMGYRANQNAINLKRRRSGMLAMTVGSGETDTFGVVDVEYLSRFVNSATTVALSHGFALVLIPAARAEAVSGFEVDGAIIIDPCAGDPVLEELELRGIPVVTSGRVPGRDGGFWVDNDLVFHTKEMLDHMAGQGADRIGLIAPPSEFSYGIDFARGYEAWCEEHGQEPLIVRCERQLTETAGYEAALQLIERHDGLTGIFAGVERYALGALLAAHSRGIEVPGRPMLLASGTDSLELAQATTPVTALDLHPETAGANAVELMLECLADPDREPTSLMIPTEITVRASTSRVSAPTGT